MPANDPLLSFPVRGSGCRTPWEAADVADEARLRVAAEAAENRLMTKTAVLGMLLQDETREEQLMAERERARRWCRRA